MARYQCPMCGTCMERPDTGSTAPGWCYACSQSVPMNRLGLPEECSDSFILVRAAATKKRVRQEILREAADKLWWDKES